MIEFVFYKITLGALLRKTTEGYGLKQGNQTSKGKPVFSVFTLGQV